MSKLETTIYIVGRKRNWELRSGHLTAILMFLGAVFLTLLGLFLYQYLSHRSAVDQLQQRYNEEKFKIEKLQETLQQRGSFQENSLPEESVSSDDEDDLLKQMQAKDELIAQLQNQLASSTQPKDQILSKLQAQDQLLNKLRAQEQEYTQQISELMQKVEQLQKESQSPTAPVVITQANVTPVMVDPRSNEAPVVVEQFRISTLFQQNFSVQFHLKNVVNSIQSGYIRILPVPPEQFKADIPFDANEVISFQIRWFRLFSRNFTHKISTNYKAMRITVWDRDQKKLLDQYYPLNPASN